MGRGFLKNCYVFADSISSNNRSIAHFCGWWKWEGHLSPIFCGCYKWVTSKTIIIFKKKNCLGSKRVRYSQNFNLNYKTYGNLIISPLSQISRTIPLVWHFLLQSQQWNRQNNVWNMYKINNNKDARTRPITSSQFLYC